MKKIFLGLAIGVMALLSSCGGAPSEAKFSELSKDSDGKLYYGNSLYSGTATSEDGVFLTMEVEKGVIKCLEARHDNGSIAMTTSKDEGSFVLFNEMGEQISDYEFHLNYMSIQDKIDESLSLLKSR